MEHISADRLTKYFELCDKHDKEKLEFFLEYVSILKEAQNAIYNEKDYEKGEIILNKIPEDLLLIWEPARMLHTSITYKKLLNDEL